MLLLESSSIFPVKAEGPSITINSQLCLSLKENVSASVKTVSVTTKTSHTNKIRISSNSY